MDVLLPVGARLVQSRNLMTESCRDNLPTEKGKDAAVLREMVDEVRQVGGPEAIE